MKVSLFAVAAILATASALKLQSHGHSHSHSHAHLGTNTETRLHVPVVLQPYNEDGSLADPVAIDLSPKDKNVD